MDAIDYKPARYAFGKSESRKVKRKRGRGGARNEIEISTMARRPDRKVHTDAKSKATKEGSNPCKKEENIQLKHVGEERHQGEEGFIGMEREGETREKGRRETFLSGIKSQLVKESATDKSEAFQR